MGLLIVGLVTFTLALPVVAHADSVKLSGLWIDNVNVETVAEGELIYTTAAGRRVTRSLEGIEGLRLDRYPALAEAEAARERGEHAAAAEKLRAVVGQAREAWVRHYVHRQLAQALDAQGEAAEAVRVYVTLVEAEPHPAFLADPPTAAVRRASPEIRSQVVEALEAIRPRAAEAAREPLDRLRAAAEAEGDVDFAAGDGRAGGDDAIVLPADIQNDAVTAHLRRGEFDEALEAVRAPLSTTGGLSLALYQKALAQRGKAEAEDDQALLKSAGLNFMRVVVYFPRSRYVGPALVEAGAVHARIGRPDLAATLYDRARLRIDEADDPDYHRRLMTLRRQLQETE